MIWVNLMSGFWSLEIEDFIAWMKNSIDENLNNFSLLSFSVPPRVRSKPEDGNIVIKKGTEVTLECIADGNPVPAVTWTREVS